MEEHRQTEGSGREVTMLEVFVQGEGFAEIELFRVPRDSKVGDLLSSFASEAANKGETPAILLLESGEEALEATADIDSAGILHRSRIHIHRCKKIAVTVNFNGKSTPHEFAPSVPIKRVHQWAVGEKVFNLSAVDATEHALQVCNSTIRPDEDIHIGTLTKFPDCSICFDLVPKKRVEG